MEGNFTNTQLAPAGTTSPQLVDIWRSLAKRWRLCYQSVTVLQDGPDLANQGTIAVSQSTFEPRITTFSVTGTPALYSYYPLAFYDEATEGPNFERAQAMPNAMLGRSREGAYVPLKLTDTFQRWQSERDFIIPTNKGTLNPSPLTGCVTAQTTYTPAYPFPTVIPFYGGFPIEHGDCVPGLMNGSAAHICARNLSDQTSFTFHFRMGIEIQLDPSSTLTPQLKLSPPVDMQAMDMYFRISRELKDAYPADYNVTGKLWTVLSNAVRAIAPPLLRAVNAPYLIPVAEKMIDAADATADIVRARRKKRKAKRQQKQTVMTVPAMSRPLGVNPRRLQLAAPAEGPSAAEVENLQENRRMGNQLDSRRISAAAARGRTVIRAYK